MIAIITIHAILGQNDLYSLFCKMRNAVFYKSTSGCCRNLSRRFREDSTGEIIIVEQCPKSQFRTKIHDHL